MKKISLIVLILSISSASYAITKSAVCMLTYQQALSLGPAFKTLASKSDTLTFLKSFQEKLAGKTEVQAQIHEGYSDSSKMTPDSAIDIAERIQSILDHKALEIKSDHNKNFSHELVVVGKEDILNYLDNLQVVLDKTAKGGEDYAVLVNVIGITVALHAALSPIDLAMIGSLLAAQMNIEYSLRHRLSTDTEINQAILNFVNLLNSNQRDYWGAFSRNSKTDPQARLYAEGKPVSTEVENLGYALFYQNLNLSAPTLYRLLISLVSKIFPMKSHPLKVEWLSLDFFLVKNNLYEPELHVIIRGSENPPL